jgi:hypothetical protein
MFKFQVFKPKVDFLFFFYRLQKRTVHKTTKNCVLVRVKAIFTEWNLAQ